jgi:hypothetical protein
MAPIPLAPNDYRDCMLYKVLLQKSTGAHGAVDKFEALVETSAPLLDAIIAGPFRNFTLHNRDHAKKLLHLSEYVIDEATIQTLSVLECMVIAYSAYLHDLGMCVTSPEERKAIIESKEFQDVFADWPELSDALKRARRRLQEVSATESGEPSNEDAAKLEAERLQIENELFQLQEAGLVAFLRPRHATEERYKGLVEFLKKASGRSDLFEFRGVSFEQHLINICVSHNLDAGALAEVHVVTGERFPRDLVISGQTLNSQFCAAVLRVTDILDFDRERTPRVLFESLGISGRSLPGAHVSLQEWQKHMAVHSIDIRPNEIVVAAECKHPVIEKAIREFCGLIEREVRDTSTVLAHNTAGVAGSYKLRLPIVVRPQVTSVGYVYKDMSLGMNQVAIMTLLMGEHLYSRKGVALRELIQNAVDACVVRQKLASDKDYAPAVDLRLFEGKDNQTWVEITDNGIGMDEHVLSEYFLKLGNSYYRSAEFHRLSRGSQFVPISRFGIGIASLFMIGDVLEVTTVAANSPRQDTTSRFVRIERMGGLAYVSENVDWAGGTRVRIRLNAGMQPESQEFAREVIAYLKETVVRPKVSVTVKIGSVGFVTGPERWLTPKAEANQQLLLSGKELIPITLTASAAESRGLRIFSYELLGIIFHYSILTEVGSLHSAI